MQNRDTVLWIVVMVFLIAVGLQAQTWRKLSTTSANPEPRRNAAGAYDPDSNKLFIFGGVTANGNTNDLWQFDLGTQQWSAIITSDGVAPAARFGHNAVYDSKRRRIIIWAGQGAGFFNDVWAFDIATSKWKELMPSTVRPNQRYGSAAVYDSNADRMVMFAGFTTSGRFNDTQAFVFGTNSWSDLTPAGTKPNIRCLHTASYDGPRQRMMVYGGQTSGALDDIWGFDLLSNAWTNLTPSLRPPARFFSSSVTAAGNMIIFGGSTGSQNLNDVWSFDLTLNAWTQLLPQSAPPEQRNGHVAVYVPQERSMLIFGGTGSSLYNDVWKLENVVTSIDRAQFVAKEYRLEQNYPNPFNPATNFKFTISNLQLVSLKLYDLLGKEVATLVQEDLSPGTYNVSWDASGMPSGTYFYQLSANGLVRTRKMNLIK